MPINTSLLVVGPSLEMYFVDKTTGSPLSTGLVYFYVAGTNFTIAKNVYDQNGNALTNPVVLSSVGTFQDANGNNIIPYFYPFDSSGNPELYDIRVYSSLNGITPATLQFQRTNWPPSFNVTENTPTAITTANNEVPNGQFVTHNNGPVWGGSSLGQVINNATGVYNIAPGGWTFERPAASAATDFVTFSRFGSSIGNPTGNPRYALNVNCTSASGVDAYKRVCLKFRDVNKFSDTSAVDNTYTLSFTANATGSAVNVSLFILQNFGTGGSPQNAVPIGTTIAVTTGGYAIYQQSFSFPTTQGFTIGANDDDYVQIAFYFPTSTTFNISLTDFILTRGIVQIEAFADETDADMLTRSVSGWMPIPDPNGKDAYLPVVLTPTGYAFDHTQIGKVFAASSPEINVGELICDGSSYVTSAFSSDGIPYSRLQAKYFNNGDSTNVPKYGTGANFVTAYISTLTTNLILLNTNQSGSQTAPADGGTGTTFTFTKVITGSGGYDFTAYTNASNTLTMVANTAGAGAGTTADVNSGFTVTPIRNINNTYQQIQIATTAGSAITGGHYFTFYNTTTAYNMWFKVGGTGSSPGGNAIEVDITTAMSATDIASIVANAISGNQIYTISTVSASSVPQSSYFTFTANSVPYTVWYNKAGGGTAPVASNLIQVNLTGTETAAQVAIATQKAINSYQFAVPDYRGLIFRGTETAGAPFWDLDKSTRFSQNNALGTGLGSLELDQFPEHNHTIFYQTVNNVAVTGALPINVITFSGSLDPTSLAGGSESRPVNVYVNYVVKY